jgi:hypothetical protein
MGKEGIMNQFRILLGTTLLAAALLVPVRLFACAPYISCGGAEPCSGELTTGFAVDLREISIFLGTMTLYDPSGPCMEVCSYTMTYASGETDQMTTFDWGCDGSATAVFG